MKCVFIAENKKSVNRFLKRVIAGFLIFFLVPFVKTVFSWVGIIEDNKCLKVFLGENIKANYVNNVQIINSKEECELLQSPYVWIDGSCRIDISKEDING